MSSWRAGCVETRTSGSEGGVRKRTGRKTGTAPQLDPYAWRQLVENVADSLSKGARAVVIGRLRSRSWDTPEGEKRSVVEVEADEIAPSLRFATAEVTRTSTRATNGSGTGNGGRAKAGKFAEADAPF